MNDTPFELDEVITLKERALIAAHKACDPTLFEAYVDLARACMKIQGMGANDVLREVVLEAPHEVLRAMVRKLFGDGEYEAPEAAIGKTPPEWVKDVLENG